jgi:hypothetical protein
LPAKEKRMEREKGMKEEDRVFWSIFFFMNVVKGYVMAYLQYI